MLIKTWYKEGWGNRRSIKNVGQEVRNGPTNLEKNKQFVETLRLFAFFDQTNQTGDRS